ncbi:MAG: hypothetical protein QGI09_08930 [Dehalococcoidia bacterium]|jgi:hypothetical protein|nr:hypothetical protein [Dehalococcoidia bacterium]
MKYMPLKMLDHETLVRLNESSIGGGRRRNLAREWLQSNPQPHYPINYHEVRQADGKHEVRVSVVLNVGGLTAFLDVAPEEYETIPIVEVTYDYWEATMCAGNPPPMP